MKLVLVCALTLFLAVCRAEPKGDAEQSEQAEKYHSQYFELGDPRLCLEIDRATKFDVQRFEVLPGTGWDNLQNQPKGQVIQYNYSKCMSTDDGKFLVPDQVFTIPIKESFVDTFAEYIDTWHNTSSTTASGVNVNAGLHIGFASISGSYSHEHTQIKKKQIEDKAVTVRVQLRYHRYMSQLQPDSTLHPSFKRRLLNIAAFIELNQTDMAFYEGQLLVRDFGTHFLTSITAGASLAKTDFLSRTYVASQSIDKTKMLASASASFGSFFGMSGSYSHSTTTADYQSYLKSMTHSYVTSHGGPIMKAFNMSANDWTKAVDLDLVPMDRSGDPLSFLVTEQTLPELPLDVLYDVEKTVRKAIVQYYEKNTIAGCTKLGSPNFSFSANFDDGSCEAEATNMTFGGVFQTCSVEGRYLSHNPCTGMSQLNPKTRAYSCQAPYTTVKLTTGRKRGQPESRRECHSCGFLGLFDCCDTNTYVATAVYTVYWCAAMTPNVPQDSGYLYGGSYSSTEENVISGTKGCPPTFYPRVFLDHKICISDDFEVGEPYAVPFGGFMSCSVGNPLSMPGVHPVGNKRASRSAVRPNSLRSFMAESNDPSEWPKHCPTGYSQHLITIDNGCEIRYCLKTGTLAGSQMARIKLPPYTDKPNADIPLRSQVMFSRNPMVWAKNELAYNHRIEPSKKLMSWTDMWEKVGSTGKSGASSTLAPWAAAIIGIVVTLSCGTVALMVYTAMHRRREGRAKDLGEAHQGLLEDTPAASSAPVSNYGAADCRQESSISVQEEV